MRLALPLAFIGGLLMKVLHLPYHTVFLLLVLAAGLVRSMLQIIKEKDKTVGWTALATWAWAAHLVALLKLFPFRTVTLILAAVLTTFAVYLLLKDGAERSRSFKVLAGVFILVMLVMVQPTSSRFFLTNLAYSLERSTDVPSWDKYSFFLAREGHLTEALEANTQAQTTAKASGAEDLTPELLTHRTLITANAWDTYDPLSEHAPVSFDKAH